jgi:hypothetical protein
VRPSRWEARGMRTSTLRADGVAVCWGVKFARSSCGCAPSNALGITRKRWDWSAN